MWFSDKIDYYLHWGSEERVTNSFVAVQTEIQRRLDGWKFKLEEIEKKYSELAVRSCKPKRGKRVKMSKDETWSQLADYAAEVVFEFF